MILITIDEHPLQSDAFDKFLAGMAIEAECCTPILRADYAHRLSLPVCAEDGIPCGHCTECQPGAAGRYRGWCKATAPYGAGAMLEISYAAASSN